MESKKRKRESDPPRITFRAKERTFDRLFKEDSLDEMKEVVKKKLGLEKDSVVLLSQVRDGRSVDLEDDEDFEAFCSVVDIFGSATVRVDVGPNVVRPNGVQSSMAGEGSSTIANVTSGLIENADGSREKSPKSNLKPKDPKRAEDAEKSKAPNSKKQKLTDGQAESTSNNAAEARDASLPEKQTAHKPTKGTKTVEINESAPEAVLLPAAKEPPTPRVKPVKKQLASKSANKGAAIKSANKGAAIPAQKSVPGSDSDGEDGENEGDSPETTKSKPKNMEKSVAFDSVLVPEVGDEDAGGVEARQPRIKEKAKRSRPLSNPTGEQPNKHERKDAKPKKSSKKTETSAEKPSKDVDPDQDKQKRDETKTKKASRKRKADGESVGANGDDAPKTKKARAKEDASLPATSGAQVQAATAKTTESIRSKVPPAATTETKEKNVAKPHVPSACRVCGQSPMHPRVKCSVIVAGPSSIQKRAVELRTLGGKANMAVARELEAIVAKFRESSAEKDKEKEKDNNKKNKKKRVENEEKDEGEGDAAAAGKEKQNGAKAQEPPAPATTSKAPKAKKTDLKETRSDQIDNVAGSRRPAEESLLAEDAGDPRKNKNKEEKTASVPKGSKISEVTVEREEEGSSEESDDEESDDEEKVRGKGVKENQDVLEAMGIPAGTSLLDVDLDALVNGQGDRQTVNEVLSAAGMQGEELDDEEGDSSSGDEEESEEVLEKMARSIKRFESSSDEEEDEESPKPNEFAKDSDSSDEEDQVEESKVAAAVAGGVSLARAAVNPIKDVVSGASQGTSSSSSSIKSSAERREEEDGMTDDSQSTKHGEDLNPTLKKVDTPPPQIEQRPPARSKATPISVPVRARREFKIPALPTKIPDTESEEKNSKEKEDEDPIETPDDLHDVAKSSSIEMDPAEVLKHFGSPNYESTPRVGKAVKTVLAKNVGVPPQIEEGGEESEEEVPKSPKLVVKPSDALSTATSDTAITPSTPESRMHLSNLMASEPNQGGSSTTGRFLSSTTGRFLPSSAPPAPVRKSFEVIPPSSSAPPATTKSETLDPTRRSKKSAEEKERESSEKRVTKEEKARLKAEKVEAKAKAKAKKLAEKKAGKGEKGTAEGDGRVGEDSQVSVSEWATLAAPSSTPGRDDSQMIDQLQPSSPLPDTSEPKGKPKRKTKKSTEPSTASGDVKRPNPLSSPLFLESESQLFPYSQLNIPQSQLPKTTREQAAVIQGKRSAKTKNEYESEDGSGDEGAKALLFTPGRRRTLPNNIRRLTDIARKPLFSPSLPQTPGTAIRSQSAVKSRSKEMYGKNAVGSEDDDSSSSESEGEKDSHIPKGRTAGVLSSSQKSRN